jgi:hypothetical protein
MTELVESQHGSNDLPAWGRDDLPEPLPFSVRNVFRTIGPGAILLAASIGGGEWLVGPAMAVEHGLGVFWIATLAISLQILFNLEAIRYTLYTGEPILSGIMRLRPGSKFWAIAYVVLTGAQLGVPALAAGCATVLFASFFGMPAEADAGTLVYFTYVVLAVAVVILLFGGTIERMLEYASWFMIVFIFLFLLFANVVFVSAEHWGETLFGFFEFGRIPAGTDMLLLAAMAASAGSGGIGNLAITNWIRDKGMGMGGRVGAIPSAVGSHKMQLSHVGKVFPLTLENMRRWRVWCKYVVADQVWLWGSGCLVGMFLNVNLASAIIPPGTSISGTATGAYQAKFMAEHLWTGFWFLALLNGFWILFSTHLGNTDILVRTITDIFWVASRRARAWRGGGVTAIYYSLLFGFTIWGAVAVNWGNAMSLFKAIAAVAGFVLALAAVQVLLVNTRLLPKELQPPLWRKAALIACALFYSFMTGVVVWDQIRDQLIRLFGTTAIRWHW